MMELSFVSKFKFKPRYKVWRIQLSFIYQRKLTWSSHQRNSRLRGRYLASVPERHSQCWTRLFLQENWQFLSVGNSLNPSSSLLCSRPVEGLTEIRLLKPCTFSPYCEICKFFPGSSSDNRWDIEWSLLTARPKFPSLPLSWTPVEGKLPRKDLGLRCGPGCLCKMPAAQKPEHFVDFLVLSKCLVDWN